MDGHHDLAAGHVPLADLHIEIFNRLALLEFLQHRFDGLLRHLAAFLLEGAGEDRAAELHILMALLGADEAADARARPTGDDEALPGRRRGLRAAGYDLDLVAVLQPG